ncbi:MAG: protein phosphatase 2C domain-containing protein [Azoarcus sp.]|jgi:serine/threonine protein phosphatase PrpC|nr:protein phosphatase 2C domain-containing protein [Azoarcus sp.]
MRVSVETCIARHTGDRKDQQDRVAVLTHPSHPGALLVALADGMGGHNGGGAAADQVAVAAHRSLEAFTPATDQPERVLDAAIRSAHGAIRMSQFAGEQDPHSTVALYLLYRGKAYWAHCGDSRIYHFRDRQLLVRTNDHSLVGELQRRGKLSEEEALRHPQRNVLVSCLGGDRPPRIEHGECGDVVLGDRFLLCTDGFWHYFGDGELAATLADFSAPEAAQRLLGLARQRAKGHGDNIAFAIIGFVAVKG